MSRRTLNATKRFRAALRRVLVSILLVSFLPVATANAREAETKTNNPPARCVDAVRKVNMDFDQPGPTYYFVFTLDALTYCRPNDWLSVARTRVSRSRTIEDYNYQRVPAVALSGKDLVSLRKWMCGWMRRERREDASSSAYRVLLACGEKPGADTRKGVKVITTTSTSTTTTLSPVLPTVSLRLSQSSASVQLTAKVVENGNGNAIRYCILLNGRDFYDVSDSLLISDGAGNSEDSGPNCLDLDFVPSQNDFEGLRGGIYGRYQNLPDCSDDSSGRISICKTVSVSLKFIFENGREATSNVVPVYLRNTSNRLNGSTGWWTTEYSWYICRDPVELIGQRWVICASGSN